MIVNLGMSCGQGRLVLTGDFLGQGDRFVLADALRDQRGEWTRADLTGDGLAVRVPAGQAQLLSIEAATN